MRMNVKVKYWGDMLTLTGKKQEEISATTVNDVLSYLQTQYGKASLKAAKRMLIAVNGTNIQLLGRYKTPLAEGDVIAFFPLCAGG